MRFPGGAADRWRSASIVMVLTLITLAAAACSAREVPYEEEIAAWHAEKDRFMRESSESPVTADKRAAFPNLSYFPINRDYRVPASLALMPAKEILDMPTSTGQRRRMLRVGALEFTLKGEAMKLTAFVEATDRDLRRLFVPFGDRTNGT